MHGVCKCGRAERPDPALNEGAGVGWSTPIVPLEVGPGNGGQVAEEGRAFEQHDVRHAADGAVEAPALHVEVHLLKRSEKDRERRTESERARGGGGNGERETWRWRTAPSFPPFSLQR